ncbi:MAG: hypothetical protein EU532_01255 [Promethearchaeota archaeon]|nr:MAG: hypothetical protein EU532_01255 [Candidatus Lokiarchaeota archaeon]
MSTQSKPQEKKTEPKKPKPKKSSGDEGLMNLANFLGKIAWIIVLIEGFIFIFWGIYYLYWASVVTQVSEQYGVYSYVAADIATLTLYGVLYIIGGILGILFAVAFVKPRFSNKWADKDYDYLLNDVIKLGSTRIPLFLIIGIILEIFMSWWGGLIILVPLLILIFAGPKEYKWTEK